MESPSYITETPLEHFELIEDVVAHIKAKLPAESGSNSWKNVCEDVLHCQLPLVEPLLLQELAANTGNTDEQEKIRGLLRAVSWYKHPPKSVEDLGKILNHLRPTHPDNEDQADLNLIQSAFEQQLEGENALPAADAVDRLFVKPQPEEQKNLLRQVRDQVYYQALYPHWFDVVKRWAATKTT